MSKIFEHINSGISTSGRASDPSDPENGDLYYNTTSNVFRQYLNGAWSNVSSGTVTSVAASVPSFLSISGSPVTTSGTLAISYSGTALPVLNGGTGVTTSTGSGNAVLSISPTLTGTVGASAITATGVVTSNSRFVVTNAGSVLPAAGAGGVASSTVSGLELIGQGSTSDIAFLNKNGSQAFTIPTGTNTINFPALTASTSLALDSSKNVVSVTNTGTGNAVLDTSPTIITPTITTSAIIPLINGGTTASSTLTLQSTSGTGTSDSIIFKTGSQTTAIAISTGGQPTFSFSANFSRRINLTAFGVAPPTAGNGQLSSTSTDGLQLIGNGSNQDITFLNSGGSAIVTIKNSTLIVGVNNNILGSDGTSPAAAGNIGEYIETVVSTATNFPTNNNYGDLGSIVLTAGDWDVSYILNCSLNSATMTFFEYGIGTTSGNSGAGLTRGVNAAVGPSPTAGATNDTRSIPSYRIRVTGSTTYYAKVAAGYSAGNPQYTGRMSARRMR